MISSVSWIYEAQPMDKLMKFLYISQIMLKIFCNYIVLKNMLFVDAKL